LLITAILSVIFMGLMAIITGYYAKKTRDLWKITQASLSLNWIKEILNGKCETFKKQWDKGSRFMEKRIDDVLALIMNRTDFKDIPVDFFINLRSFQMILDDSFHSFLGTMENSRVKVVTELIRKNLPLSSNFVEVYEKASEELKREAKRLEEEYRKKRQDAMKELENYIKSQG